MQTFSSFVAEALAKGPTTGRHHYLVVDLAVAEGQDMSKELRITTGAIDILTGETCRWRDCASPVLLALPGQGFGAAAAMATERALEKWRYANALAYIESVQPFANMCRSLQARTEALLPQNMEVLLRFFDTRVLTRLLTLLPPIQRRLFLSAGTTWAFPDRWGHLQIECQEAQEDSFVRPLQIDKQQEAALIDAGDADAVVDTLLNQGTPKLEFMLPPHQYEKVSDALAQAKAWRIEVFSEQVAFCSLCLELGQDFAEKAPWNQWLLDVRSGKKKFSDMLATASEGDSN